MNNRFCGCFENVAAANAHKTVEIPERPSHLHEIDIYK